MRPWRLRAIVALLAASSASAQPKSGPDVARPRLAVQSGTKRTLEASRQGEAFELSVIKRRLTNGLRVVLSPDERVPSVAVSVTYDVGARNDKPGQRGLSHLVERLMFQGSRNLEKGDHYRLVTSRGGSTGSSTSSESTSYYTVLPSSDIALGLWLEADRMKTLAIGPKKFENQRAILQEEYRAKVTNRVYSLGRLRLQQLAFQGYPPYEHTALGAMEDLDAAQLEWARGLYDSHYAPNNAVLCIAGHFDADYVFDLVQRYFGDAETRAPLSKLELPALPRQTSERLSVVEDTGAKTPGVYYGWVVPAGRTSSHYALELFRLALAQGESSRLHQLLVRDKAMAQDVSAELTHHRGPSLFAIRVVVARSSSIDKTQRELDGHLRTLRVTGLTPAELDKAKARVRSRFLLGLQSNVRRALALGTYETVWGDARLINDEVEKYEAVTLADIRRAVGEHLLDTRRTIVEVYPPGWAKDYYPDILRRAHIVKKGENLIKIAKQYGIPPGDLARHNKLQLNRPIFPGQKLTIPPGARRAPASSARPSSAPLAGKGPASGGTSSASAPVASIRMKTHVVANGETLGRIAKRYGVQVSDIVAHNKIGKDKRIYIGQRLVIPIPARQK